VTSGIEVILFDVGGVLVEVAGIDNLRQWTDPASSDEEVWTLWLTSRAARAFERGRIDAPEFARELIAEHGLPVQPEALLDGFPAWIAGVLPGARELLNDVVPGVQVGTLSNSNPAHWPRIMVELGLDIYFDTHFVSHQTGRIKPDPEAFDYAIGELGCRADTILFVDDNQVNVDGAIGAGMRAHLAHGPHEARQILARYGLIKARAKDLNTEREDDV